MSKERSTLATPPKTTSETEAAGHSDVDLLNDPRVGAALVVVTVALLPLALARILWWAPGGAADFNQRVSVSPYDVALLLVTLRWLRRLQSPRKWRRPVPFELAALAFAALLLVAFAFHPSPLGVALIVRGLACVAVVATMLETRHSETARRLLFVGIAAVGVEQSVLAMAQSLHGGHLGLGPLEFEGYMYPFGSSTAGEGGFSHPYHFACFALVAFGATLLGLKTALRRAPWLVALGVTSTGITITYSRSAALGMAAAVIVLCVAGVRQRRDRAGRTLLLAVAVTLAGVAVGVGGFGDGWLARGKQSSDTKALDSNRRLRLQEAGRLVAKSPLVGIGPGRYVVVLKDVKHQTLLPAHNVVAHEAAEAGVLAGALAGLLLVGLAWRTWRRGAWCFAVFLTLAPFFILDAYPYVFATGLLGTALWIGLLELAGDDRSVV